MLQENEKVIRGIQTSLDGGDSDLQEILINAKYWEDYNVSDLKTIDGKSIFKTTEDDENNIEIHTNRIIDVTYSELKSLRDNSELQTGTQYRITDYVTTTAQENTMSAGHVFDIIVAATSENTLSEVAKVVHSDRNEISEVDVYNKYDWKDLDNWHGGDDCPIPSEIYAMKGYKSHQLGSASYSANQYIKVTFVGSDDSGEQIKGLGVAIYENNKLIAVDYGIKDEYYLNVPKDGYYALYFYAQGISLDLSFGNCGVVVDVYTPHFIQYFIENESKLDAWEIKYCLDNDTNRFAWADNINGKGVIYYMKDEFGNEAHYDFKNIMFKRDSTWVGNHKGTDKFSSLNAFDSNKDIWFYTFSRINGTTITDDSLNIGLSSNAPHIYPCRNNTILPYSKNDNNIIRYYLNNNIFIGNGADSNHFGENSIGNTFGGIYNNYFEMGCQNNVVYKGFSTNHIGINFKNNLITNAFNYNNVDSNFYGNQLGSFLYCKFGNNFKENNSLGKTIKYCDFGNDIMVCSDLPSMTNVIFDNSVIKNLDGNNKPIYNKGLKDIELTSGETAYNVLSKFENNTSKVLFTKQNNVHYVIDIVKYIIEYNDKIELLYDLGVFSSNKDGEDAASNISVIRNPEVLFLKFYNSTSQKNVYIQQMVVNHKCAFGQYGYAKQYIYLDGKTYFRKCWFTNLGGSYSSVVNNSNYSNAWILVEDEDGLLYSGGVRTLTENDIEKFVTLEDNQIISGSKQFNNDINLAGKTIIKSTIDDGELKVFNANDDTAGFTICTKDKFEGTNIPKLELFATNNDESYKYQFPKLANPNDIDTVVVESKLEDYITNSGLNGVVEEIVEEVRENEKVTAAALNDLNSKINNLEFDVSLYMVVTYSELYKLRGESELVPGMQYRIKDYVTTTKQENTSSAGNKFDIIVTADSISTFNEIAKVCKSDGTNYFDNVNLSAWKVWYCFDNDVNRFAWADTLTGKGVIYRMIDEWGNDCPYDFKNIKFKIDVNKDDYYYTFNYYSDGITSDYSIVGNVTNVNVYDNIIGTFSSEGRMTLNNIVFKNKGTEFNDYGSECHSNIFGVNCHSNSLNTGCYSNIFGENCVNNVIGRKCNFNTFGNYCNSNKFGNNCGSNVFGDYCNYNTFGNNCNSNKFGNNCGSNKPNDYDSNESYVTNIFGNNCNSNKFGNNCNFNKFGNNCNSNTFGDGCEKNILGSYNEIIKFGSKCLKNIIINTQPNINVNGDNIDINEYDPYNSNSYVYNKLSSNKKYVRYITFGDSVQNNIFWSTGVVDENKYVQSYEVDSNLVGKIVELKSPVQASYLTRINTDSLGFVQHYIEKDLSVKNISYKELLDLRTNSRLTPSRKYRITDYVTTTIQDDTQSGNNLFDIIVEALSEDTLSESVKIDKKYENNLGAFINYDSDFYYVYRDWKEWSYGNMPDELKALVLQTTRVKRQLFTVDLKTGELRIKVAARCHRNTTKNDSYIYSIPCLGFDICDSEIDEDKQETWNDHIISSDYHRYTASIKGDVDKNDSRPENYEVEYVLNVPSDGRYTVCFAVDDSEDILTNPDKALRSELGVYGEIFEIFSKYYFENSNLNAWEVKYCLDNDTNRFAWADEENGKGVIYYMKDEFGNEAHYDFKNIKFNCTIENYPFEYAYTFSDVNGNDLSLSAATHENTIKPYISSGKQILNHTIFIGNNIHSNTLDDNNYKNIIFVNDCYYNNIGNEFQGNNITSQNSFHNNIIGNLFKNNIIQCVFDNSEDYQPSVSEMKLCTFGDGLERVQIPCCQNVTFEEQCLYNNDINDVVLKDGSKLVDVLIQEHVDRLYVCKVDGGCDIFKYKDLYTLEEKLEENIKSTKEGLEENIKSTKEGLEENIKSTKEGLEENIKSTKEGLEENIKSTKEGLEENIKSTKENLEESIKLNAIKPIYSNPNHDFDSGSNNGNFYGYVGNLYDLNVFGDNILIDSISVYVREGKQSPNLDTPVWCRLMKYVNDNWEIIYQSEKSKTIKGIQPENLFTFKMVSKSDNPLLKTSDKIAIVYVSSENADVLSGDESVELGFKTIDKKGGLTSVIANDNTVQNYSPAFVFGYISMASETSELFIGTFDGLDSVSTKAAEIDICSNSNITKISFKIENNQRKNANGYIEQFITGGPYTIDGVKCYYTVQTLYFIGENSSRLITYTNDNKTIVSIGDWKRVMDYDNDETISPILYSKNYEVVNIGSDQTISGSKQFNNDININGKTIIKSTIDDGELKVFNANDDTSGFTICTNDKFEGTNIPKLKLFATNNVQSYKYQFPKLANPNDTDIVVVKSQFDQSIEDVTNTFNQSIEDVNQSIEDVRNLINVTYSELFELRNNNQLVPGQSYRIIDYATTTTQENTKSAKHNFDIIVKALNNNTLLENASVCRCFNSKRDHGVEISSDIFNYTDENDWYDYGHAYGGPTLPDDVLKLKNEANIDIVSTDYGKIQISDVNQYLNKIFRITLQGTDVNGNKIRGFGATLIKNGVIQDFDFGFRDEFYLSLPESATTGEYVLRFYAIGTTSDMNDGYAGARAELFDTTSYFNDSYLNAWEIKYSLDNDTNRFAWADTVNGKGVIHYMKDEFGNEAPYDFKNIKCGNFYTFDYEIENVHYDGSTIYGKYCYGNKIDCYKNSDDGKYYIPENIMKNINSDSKCYCNIFKNNAISNIFGDGCYNNIIGVGSCNNIFEDNCYSNTFGDNCNENKIGTDCNSNIFGKCCDSNALGSESNFNTFGNKCVSNIFGNRFVSNTIGNECENNTFNKNSETADNVKYVCILNGVKNTNINVDASLYDILNITILQGDYSTKNIELNKNNVCIAMNSKGNVTIFTIADIICKVNDMEEPDEPSEGDSDIIDEPSDSDSDIIDEPTDGDSEIIEEPSEGDSDIIEEPSDSDSEITDEPSDSDSDIIDEPTDGDSEITDEPSDSDSDIIEEPSDSDSDIIEEPSDSDSEITDEPSDSDSDIIDEPTDGDSEIIEEPSEGDSDIIDEPTDGDSEMNQEV